MPEKPTSNIDSEQGAIQHLKENADAPVKLKERLSDREYQQVFFAQVDGIQLELQKLTDDIKDPEISAFIEASQDEISDTLKTIAENGMLIISHEKEHATRRLSGDYAGLEVQKSNLKLKLSSISSDISRFRQLAKIQSELKASDEDPKQDDKAKSPDQRIAEKEAGVSRLNALRTRLLPQLGMGSTQKYFEEIESGINSSLAKRQAELQVLILKKDPNLFGALIKADAKKYLSGRTKDPALLEKNIKDFNEKIQPHLDELSKLDRNNDAAVVEAQKNIDAKAKELLQKQPFDQVIVQVQGRAFECRYDPPATDYEAAKANARSAVENYMNYMKDFPPATWNETKTFMNGIINVKLVYKGPETDRKKNGEYHEIRIDGNSVNEKTSSRLIDEKQDEREAFRKAFEEWQQNPDTDDFRYGKPPKTIIRRVDLLKGRRDKADATLDGMIERLSFRIPALYESLTMLPNGKQPLIQTRRLTYDRKDGKKYLKEQEETSHPVIHPDRVSSTLSEFDSDRNLLRETSERFLYRNEDFRHEISVTDYYGPDEKKNAEGSRIKKTETMEDGVIMSASEFNPEGKLVRKEIGVRGCPGVLAVEYADGKPLDEKSDYTRTMEFYDKKGEKIVITSFPDAQKSNPSLTVQQYLHFLADTLQTDELKHAFLNLMFQYTHDSPDFNEPRVKGTPDKHGDYWQTPEETARRTEHGMMLGDCDDYAFFMQRVLEYQGKSSYVMDIQDPKKKSPEGHFEAVMLERDSRGRYHAKSYGTFGVDVDGVTIGAERSGWEEDGYETKAEALRAIQQKWQRTYNLSLFYEDYAGEDKTVVHYYAAVASSDLPNEPHIRNKSKRKDYLHYRIPVGDLKTTSR